MIFTPDQVGALRTLVRLWSTERFVLIGAAALRCSMHMQWRETRDLDAVLAVSLARYPLGLEREPGWSRHPGREQTWVAPGEVQVDVIPLDMEQGPVTEITWPESEMVMNVVGLHLALDHALTIEAASGLAIRVAPPEVVAVLKMVAYQDRPYERDRDLEDIARIMDDLIADKDDQRYGDEVLDLGLRYEEISGYFLGKRLAAIVDDRERTLVERFTGMVKRAGDPAATQARMLERAPRSWQRDPEELLRRIAAFERGFQVRSGPPAR